VGSEMCIRDRKKGLRRDHYIGDFFLREVGDGMETSKRRDCDKRLGKKRWGQERMEWRPQKEGIATSSFLN